MTFVAAPESNGGIFEIGPVAFSVNQDSMEAMLAAIDNIEGQIGAGVPQHARDQVAANAAILRGTDWTAIGYIKSRDVYSTNYRGVLWEVPRREVLQRRAAIKHLLMDWPTAQPA